MPVGRRRFPKGDRDRDRHKAGPLIEREIKS